LLGVGFIHWKNVRNIEYMKQRHLWLRYNYSTDEFIDISIQYAGSFYIYQSFFNQREIINIDSY